MQRLVKYFAFVCCLLFVINCVPAPARADTQQPEQKPGDTAAMEALRKEIDNLQSKEKTLQTKLKKLEDKLSGNIEALTDAVNQKDVLDQQITLLYESIQNTNDQISSYTQMIADRQAELDAVLQQQADLTKKHKLRIRDMEERGKMSYWVILFRASSITDLLDRINMIQEIAEADQRNLEQLRRTSDLVIATREELEQNRLALDHSRTQLDQRLLELDGKRQESDLILQKLSSKGSEYQQLLWESEEKQIQLFIQLAQKKSEYNRQAYEAWMQGNQEGEEPEYYDDQWLTPLASYRLTSPFGMRYHPILKRERMHNGMDMAAPADTPIYATRGGIVMTAAYQASGAGNYVQLDHGDGFRSIYMHMTRYVVSEGEYVAPGQVIGYVGSTGLSTGNHLHFGISKDGTYVNPLEYIPY